MSCIKFFSKRACINANSNRNMSLFSCLNDSINALHRANVSWVNTERCRSSLCSFKRQLIVKVNIGNNRKWRVFANLFKAIEGPCVWNCHTDNLAPCLGKPLDLKERCIWIISFSGAHRLNGNGSAAANLDRSNHDGMSFCASNLRHKISYLKSK